MAQAPVASMPAPPSMAGVQQNTNEQTGSALDAMARGGKAGLDAFNAAQTQGQGYRQQVLGSILNNPGISPDAQSGLSAQVEASLAPRLTDMAQGQANLQGDLARGNQQYAKYGAEANAAIPVIQAQQQTQMSIRDQALQLAQQQIDADKAAKALQNQHDQAMAGLQLQAQQAQTAQAQATAAAAAAKAATGAPVTATQANKVIKGTESIGGAYATGTKPGSPGRSDVTDQMEMNAQDLAAFNHTDPTFELAKMVAQSQGITPQQALSMLSPDVVSQMNQSKPLNPPPPPDVKSIASKIGGDTKVAATINSDPQYQAAITTGLQHYASAPVDPTTGKISGTGTPADGLTPWEAYSQWLTQGGGLAPNKTRTLQVITAIYKPFLDGLAGQ